MGVAKPLFTGDQDHPKDAGAQERQTPHHLLISVADAALGIPRATFVTCLGVFSANLAGQ